MTTRLLTSLALLASLTGCVGPGLTGNDTGGIVPWTSVTREEARDMAFAHCARYDKIPVATGVDARPGGYYSFGCVTDRLKPR